MRLNPNWILGMVILKRSGEGTHSGSPWGYEASITAGAFPHGTQGKKEKKCYWLCSVPKSTGVKHLPSVLPSCSSGSGAHLAVEEMGGHRRTNARRDMFCTGSTEDQIHWLLCVRGATWDGGVSSPLPKRHEGEHVDRVLERL